MSSAEAAAAVAVDALDLLPPLLPEGQEISSSSKKRSAAVVSPTSMEQVTSSSTSANPNPTKKKERRFCKVQGCTRIVKSQGVCQRHGAGVKLCKVDGCSKQAQGNFDSMCKAHFKLCRLELKEEAISEETLKSEPPPPQGESVYDKIIPASLSYKQKDPEDENDVMPLVAHLKKGFDESRPRGWHRNEERRARGFWPVANAAVQLAGWERELVWTETCLLSGNPKASFRHLARAWGRDKGFHMVLAQFICDRGGDVERKKREKGATGEKCSAVSLEAEDEFADFDFDELPLELLDTVHHSDYEHVNMPSAKKAKL